MFPLFKNIVRLLIINKYVKGQWPELFYCEDEDKCVDMVTQYLYDNCNTDELPEYGVNKLISVADKQHIYFGSITVNHYRYDSICSRTSVNNH